jgi:hypothetical protein
MIMQRDRLDAISNKTRMEEDDDDDDEEEDDDDDDEEGN